MKRIAFVSYEYPPDTGTGGIATYVYQIAHAFAERGMNVTVVCATPNDDAVVKENTNLSIHKLHCYKQREFILLAPLRLASIHEHDPIDLIEVPDYGAEGLYIKKHVPHVPLLVKLHTPAYLVEKLNRYYYKENWYRKLFKKYNYKKDKEYKAVKKADFILSPSLSLKEIISKDWNIPFEKIIHAANPYIPDDRLLAIKPNFDSKTILYIGRLETRKGVYNLAKAIPAVLKKIPDAEFLFVGFSNIDPYRKVDMKPFLLNLLEGSLGQVRFIDKVPLDQISEHYKNAAVCIYPSIWENFPNVCLEAMSAAKIIIASQNGGMKEMLEDIEGGIMIDPMSETSIAAACIDALENKEKYSGMGTRARAKIMDYYSDILIKELMELYIRMSS
ncbi:MAG: glycosyltransferase family 4 protein [Ferruginibacter sp.]